jgi:predicted HicB family RNase H-like nuclease
VSNVFEYNGYSGSIEVSTEDHCLFGKILFIVDLVTYEAETVTDLEAEFIGAVDDYIHTCKEIGKDPQRPFKGSFNVRIAPELHRKAALEAYKGNISLNELTAKAINAYVNKTTQPINIVPPFLPDQYSPKSRPKNTLPREVKKQLQPK